MLNLEGTYPSAIDMNTRNIYAAQLRKGRRGLTVRCLAHRQLNGEIDTFPEKNGALVALIRGITRNKWFRGKRAVVHLPPQCVFSFPISFRLGKTETLEEAVLREAREYLSFPIEDAVIDYSAISTTGDNRHRAAVIAVARDQVEQYVLMFKRAGLNVEAVDFPASSLIRLHHHLFDNSEKPVILCNIGDTQSIVSVVTDETIIIQRTIPWGILVLHQKILDNFELTDDKEKAAILLRTYGLSHKNRKEDGNSVKVDEHSDFDTMRRALCQLITPHIEELIHEFHKIIGYIRSEEHNLLIKRICMYGQASLVKDLDRCLENRLNIPTKLINPMEGFSLSDAGMLPDTNDGASFALALGLSLRRLPWL